MEFYEVLATVRMNLYEAIFLRRTIKNFKMEALEPKILDQILNFTSHLTGLTGSQHAKFDIVDNVSMKRFQHKFFFNKAPYYLTCCLEKTDHYLLNGGYLLEQAALYLTMKGIASCFMGYPVNQLDKKKDTIENAIFILIFGKSKRVSQSDGRNSRRIKVEELCTFKEKVDSNMMMMLQSAILAPSIMNNQSWRFVVYGNRIHIFCKKNRFFLIRYKECQLVDMGMMLANLVIAAEEAWINVEYQRNVNLAEQDFKKNEYICTMQFSPIN